MLAVILKTTIFIYLQKVYENVVQRNVSTLQNLEFGSNVNLCHAFIRLTGTFHLPTFSHFRLYILIEIIYKYKKCGYQGQDMISYHKDIPN